MAMHKSRSPGVTAGCEFQTTCRDQATTAAISGQSGAAEARKSLRKQYWHPFQVCIQRREFESAEAQVLVREVFAGLLENAQPEARCARRDHGRMILP